MYMRKGGSIYTEMKNEKKKKKNQATFAKRGCWVSSGICDFLIS